MQEVRHIGSNSIFTFKIKIPIELIARRNYNIEVELQDTLCAFISTEMKMVRQNGIYK